MLFLFCFCFFVFRNRQVITIEQFRNKGFSSGTLATLSLLPSLQTFLPLLQCFGHICSKNQVFSLKISIFKISERADGCHLILLQTSRLEG